MYLNNTGAAVPGYYLEKQLSKNKILREYINARGSQSFRKVF